MLDFDFDRCFPRNDELCKGANTKRGYDGGISYVSRTLYYSVTQTSFNISTRRELSHRIY